jgi:twitching motility protein PilJ
MSANDRESSLARLGSGGMVKTLSVMLGIAIIVSVSGFLYLSTVDRYEKEYVALSSEQQGLAQTLAKFALSAASGNAEAFNFLKEARNRFGVNLTTLEQGSPDGSLPALTGSAEAELKEVRRYWNRLNSTTGRIADAEAGTLLIGDVVDSIQQLMPQLQAASDAIVQFLVKQRADPRQVFLATRQLMLAQRIATNVSRVLAGGDDAASAAELFGRDAELFGRVLQGMLRGAPDIGVEAITAAKAQSKLREIAVLFSSVSDEAGKIIEMAPVIMPAQLAAQDVSGSSDAVTLASAALARVLEAGAARPSVGGIVAGPWLVAVAGAVALLILILLGMSLLGASRSREAESMAQNSRNQQAILTLLDEMGDLADGDLTVQAHVTEDITGAIADSINYAIEALRNLVTTINNTSSQVAASAQGSRATAMHLAEASDYQAQQIRNAGEAVAVIAKSAGQISENSTESTDVAKRSVDIASQGATTVRKTIESMDGIREQIQETSKRIKRLGESSQEIGNIVELIDDIADQTNILALNAAMQAAMAGEAGRGFAVVADEVQRLAERSGNATKQIEALVKTIQTDTHEAVISMEQSTAGVVSGARLAEESGEALKEIENVSTYIAELIQGISDSARQQASEVSSISDTMNVIQEITTQTADGTNKTAESVGKLAEMAEDLQGSVAGFRLPA